jgi:hypothetical protein
MRTEAAFGILSINAAFACGSPGVSVGSSPNATPASDASSQVDASATTVIPATALALRVAEQPTVVVKTELPPVGIAVDATNVYWTQWKDTPPGEPQAPYPAALQCSKVACTSATLLASSASYLRTIVVDEATVYTGDAALLGCAIGGCGQALRTLATTGVWDIATSATELAWTDGTNVSACVSGACDSTTTQVAVGGALGLRMDASFVYWVDTDGYLLKCPVSGCVGVPTMLGSGVSPTAALFPAPAPHNFAIDASHVYWSTGTRIVSCGSSGCAEPTLVTTIVGSVNDMASDGLNLYWIQNGTPSGIMKCSILGCSEPTPVFLPSEATFPFPSRLALDDTSVYFTTGDTAHGSVGFVLKLPK